MKRKVGKESDGGSKKGKEVGNDNSLVSIFAKQQGRLPVVMTFLGTVPQCPKKPKSHNEGQVQGKGVKM